jgi:mono/diheme cytochrome c family protein
MRPYFYCLLFLLAPLLHAEDAASIWLGKVQPIFDLQCVKCHGPLEDKAGLLLDTPEAVLKGGEDGAVVTPGHPDDSSLVKNLATGSDPHMPPKKQLTDNEIAIIRDWITALAAAPVQPLPPTAPGVKRASIDEILHDDWAAAGITPAPLADELTFLRRVTLDLAGRIPNQKEIDAFLSDTNSAKRTALVDRLIATDDAAQNFREVWDALLMGRNSGRREDRRRDNGWFTFLETIYKTGRPWNKAVAAMITARSEQPEDKGALWFLFEKRNGHQQMAEAIAPIIYGTRIDCAQCHDHPLAREIKQGHYWGLVSVFNRSKNIEKGPPALDESAVGGFINFTNLKKESQPAVLMILSGKTIEEARPEPSAKEEDKDELYAMARDKLKVPKFSRRAQLAEAATEGNPLLARSFVNHVWALLMGRGIVHPVDEMNSKNPPSHSALLDWLAGDFAAHNYDVRRVYRNIALSAAYQLSLAGATPPEAFARAVERPLTAETMARCAQLASAQPNLNDKLRKLTAETFPDVLPRVTRATIQQAMFLANNEAYSAQFDTSPALEKLAQIASLTDRVQAVFHQVLLRNPDAAEQEQAIAYLQHHTGTTTAALSQLLWSLASGPEFLTNH